MVNEHEGGGCAVVEGDHEQGGDGCGTHTYGKER